VLLSASDVLSDMVGFARSGQPVPSSYGSDCRAALERLNRETRGDAAADEDGSPAPAEFDEIDFTPVRAPDFDAADGETPRRFAITFRPRPEMLKNANEPLYILRELRKLGELDLVAETAALPALSDWIPPVLISAGPARCAPPSTVAPLRTYSSSWSVIAIWILSSSRRRPTPMPGSGICRRAGRASR